jgi:cytidylate kinase
LSVVRGDCWHKAFFLTFLPYGTEFIVKHPDSQALPGKEVPMGVITFSREPCSGGSGIATSVASELGLRLVDKKLIEEVLVQYGVVKLKESYDAMPTFWTRFNEEAKDLARMFDRVIVAMAELGDVLIMGRAAYRVLAFRQDALHVRIKAPLASRVDRFIDRYGFRDRGHAEAALRDADRLRSSYLGLYYDVKPDSSLGFDLVIDTGKISTSAAVPLVAAAYRSIRTGWVPDRNSADYPVVDRILVEASRRVLNPI